MDLTSLISVVIPIDETCKMYNPFLEMDISKICEHLENIFNSRNK